MAAVACLGGFWVCLARVEPEFSVAEKNLAAARADGGPNPAGGIPAKAFPGEVGATVPDVPPTLGFPPLGPDGPPVVMIDAGHGGLDGGTVGNGLVEKDWTLKVALALAEELRQRGHAVALTRDSDVTLPVLERPSVVNAIHCHALISIHFNAGTSDATGVETWYSWPKKPEVMARLDAGDGRPVVPDGSGELAEAVQAAVRHATAARDRGTKNRTNLAVTSRTWCPAILIECGFLSSGPESRKIQEAAYRRKLVTGIADGYETWQKNRALNPAPAALPMVPVVSIGPDAEH